jgi:hypothetical protein
MKQKQLIKLAIREHLIKKTNSNVLLKLKSELADAAQKIYDEWEQDENGYCEMIGEGGICQDIADAMADVLINNGIECSTVSQQTGEQHVYVVAKTEDGVYNVDIPPYLYETGGGYCWKKIPDVEFDVRYVIIDRLSPDPNDFDEYIGD